MSSTQMSSTPPDRSTKPRHYAYRKMLSRALGFWHRGSAWILGPLLVGLVAVGMAFAAEYIADANRWLFSAFPFAPILIVPPGFALISFLTRRYFPGTQGSGIPQTMAAINDLGPAKRSDLLSIKIAFGKIMLTLGGLLIGASIGREGPTVQIGASIMNVFHGRGPFKSIGQRRIFLLAGGAAGIAGAFNTPLAGIMFAIEELSKKHVFNANSSTLITVILSGLISLALLGNYTYFGSTSAYLEWQSSLVAITVCGVIGGAAGGVFSRLLITATFEMPARIARYAKEKPLAFAAACGLVLAVLGVSTGGIVFGTGYQPTRLTLEDNGTLPWYFGVAKLLATLITSIAGLPGGIFAPSLAAGAGIGENIASLMPSIAAHSAIVLLVMAAYLSGVTRAPITSFIIMMEMTDSHHMLLPLMSVSVIASAISKLICPTALYQALATNFAAAPGMPAAATVNLDGAGGHARTPPP
jgi:H+/Cl- antiporter ClcA